MIELDGQTYPSEVRQSQPVPLETQETPAGSTEFPGLSEGMGGGREIVEGESISTENFAPDLDTLRSTFGSSGTFRAPALLTPLSGSGNEGEDYDGNLADPGGSGAPMPRASESAPLLVANEVPWQPGEQDAARGLLAEMREVSADAKPLRFVRYVDAKRIMLVFSVDEENQSVQQQY